jgi:hypothetical protein
VRWRANTNQRTGHLPGIPEATMNHDLFRARAVTSSVTDRAATPPQPPPRLAIGEIKNGKGCPNLKRITTPWLDLTSRRRAKVGLQLLRTCTNCRSKSRVVCATAGAGAIG